MYLKEKARNFVYKQKAVYRKNTVIKTANLYFSITIATKCVIKKVKMVEAIII